MSDLLLNALGITETKIAMFDIMIRACEKNDGLLTINQLKQIKDAVIKEAGKGEMNEALEIQNKIQEQIKEIVKEPKGDSQ